MTDIVTTFADGVLMIAFNRPEKKNAITQAMYGDLTQAMQRARDNDEVRAVLFRGEGDSFCAGNDIADFAAVGAGTSDPSQMQVFGFLEALARFEKPVVAAVQGRAVGIGLTLLLHCDMVVVAEDALLSVPFVNLALAPEAASTLLLPMVIGHQRAFEMFALGEAITGTTAYQWGLANRVVSAEGIDEAAMSLARALAKKAPGSIRGTKRLMRDGDALWTIMQREAAIFGNQMRSPEAMEAFMAFSQKRDPKF